MLLKLLLAFTIVPLIELYLLLRLASLTTPMTTFGIVILTGIIGSYLARMQGVQVLVRFRQAMAEGRLPAPEIQDGLLIFFAAGLLLTPGLLTDAFGFILLIPPTRAIVRHAIASRLKWRTQIHATGFGQTSKATGDTVEAEHVQTVDERSV